LEIELIQGTTTDPVSTYFPTYTAKGLVKLNSPYSDVYTLLTSQSFEYYFFDMSPNIYGCVITNDAEGYIEINQSGGKINQKIYLKNLFSQIEAGYKYSVSITIDQHAMVVGNISIDAWQSGGSGTATITQ
jgi:hypothetical protein